MGENSITYGIWKRFILSVLGAALLIVVFPDNSLAQSTYTIKPTIIEPEKLGNLGISAIKAQELASKIQEFKKEYDSDDRLISTLYFFDLTGSKLDRTKQHIAIVEYANTDYLQIYRPKTEGTHLEITLGDELNLNPMQARYRLPTIELSAYGDTPDYLIIQALDTIKIQFDLIIDERMAFDRRVQRSQLNYGLFFGAIITLSIYSLILFFVTRERSYFWYSAYLVCMVGLLITNNGLGQFLIWPGATGITTKVGFISSGGLILTLSMFVSTFINLKNGFELNNLITRIVMLATATSMLASLWLHHGILDDCFFLLASVQMINILVISYRAFRQQQVASIYLFLGYLILFPAIVISILKFSGLLDSTYFTNHAIEASLLIEAFILSIGVGEKIRQIKIKQFITVEELRDSKQNFLNALISVREREKKEFGVVLHNSVVQNLAVLRTKFNRFSDSKDVERKSVIEVIDNTIDEVREISHQSYPHILEQFGLAEATKNYAETNLDAREIDWSCRIDDSRLNKDQSLLLYRIIQESINNTYRHADASKVSIQLQFLNSCHQLEIQDDGCGFKTLEEGFGLSLIKQYALHLDGTHEIVSAPNSGTLIKIIF